MNLSSPTSSLLQTINPTYMPNDAYHNLPSILYVHVVQYNMSFLQSSLETTETFLEPSARPIVALTYLSLPCPIRLRKTVVIAIN